MTALLTCLPDYIMETDLLLNTWKSLNSKFPRNHFFKRILNKLQKLYNVVRDFAGLTGKEIIYDLYYGTGSIGIYLSKGAKKIIGIDITEDAIGDAKENALLNNIGHAWFFTGDVIHICDDDFFVTHGRPDVVIIDRPPPGMHQKLVQKLLDIGASKIVYVSCNVATQARDINLLNEKYHVEKVQPIYMFRSYPPQLNTVG